jgi:hypothetical protein
MVTDPARRVTADECLSPSRDDVAEISSSPISTECLRRVVLDRRVRLLGVRVSALHKSDAVRDGVLQHGLLLDNENGALEAVTASTG